MQTRFTLRCMQSGEKCSFISLLAACPFNKYKFLIKILSSSVKVSLHNNCHLPRCPGAMETLQLVLDPYLTFRAESICNWMAVPCVKNHYGRTYFDKFMPTCLRGAVFWDTVYICYLFSVFLANQACFTARLSLTTSFCRRITYPLNYSSLSQSEKCRSLNSTLKTYFRHKIVISSSAWVIAVKWIQQVIATVSYNWSAPALSSSSIAWLLH